MYTFPTQYAPIIILLLKKHIAYLTYTMCSEYHNTTKVAYCVPCTICSNYHSTTEVAYFVLYLHNMLPLSRYYKDSILCTQPSQYAHITIILPRLHTVCLTCIIRSKYHITSPIIIILPRLHIVYLTYTICSEYHNTIEVAYCVPYLHNMLQLS